MWPFDFAKALEFVERQSPRVRTPLAFLLFTAFQFSTYMTFRALLGWHLPVADSLICSVVGGILLTKHWRDRRRAQEEAESEAADASR